MSRVPAQSGAIWAEIERRREAPQVPAQRGEQKEVARRGHVHLERELRSRGERLRAEQQLAQRRHGVELRVGEHRVAALPEIGERDERQVPLLTHSRPVDTYEMARSPTIALSRPQLRP